MFTLPDSTPDMNLLNSLVVNKIAVCPRLMFSKYCVCFEQDCGSETLLGVKATKYELKIHKAINQILIILQAETFSRWGSEQRCTPPYRCPLAYD